MPRRTPTTTAKKSKTPTGYRHLEYVSAIDDSPQPYALWVPAGYTSRKAWPLLVTLHGSDADHRMIPEDCFRIPRAGFDERMLLLSPFGRGDVDWRWMGETDLWEAVRHVRETYRIDGRRIYLAGLSMGAFATWRLAAEFPDQFAAIVPICGGGEPATMPDLRRKPVWCVHGSADAVVPVERSRTLVAALRKLGSPIRYDELPGRGHDSWNWLLRPERRGELVDWLLLHKQPRAAPPVTAPHRSGGFADLLGERLVISYPAGSEIPQESALLRAEAERLARFQFGDRTMRTGRLLVKPDDELTDADLLEANLLVIGRSDNHPLLRRAGKRLLARHDEGRLVFRGETLLGKNWATATVQPSPWRRSRLLGLMTYQQRGQIAGLGARFMEKLDGLGAANLLDTRSGILTAFSGRAGAV